MRIAITGASGLLGRALIDEAADKHEIVAAFHSSEILDLRYLEQYPLDLAHEDSIRRFIETARADLIIHSAAITDVDLCEREPKLAQIMNAEGTRRIVEAIRNTSTRIVYISTDYVFDGTAGPYAETAPTHPINIYGKTKLEGEVAVLSMEERGTIVRSASFLGRGGPLRPTFVERMLETMRDQPPLQAAYDQRSNITPVDGLASGIIRIVETGASGIWHIAHPQILSRHDLAVLIAERAGIDSSHIQRVSYDSLKRDAVRPLAGGLKTDKAARDLMLTFRPLQESIQMFLNQA